MTHRSAGRGSWGPSVVEPGVWPGPSGLRGQPLLAARAWGQCPGLPPPPSGGEPGPGGGFCVSASPHLPPHTLMLNLQI